MDRNLDTVSGAAETWACNADATRLTFTLRSDLTYCDGSLLNAARFAYSIKRNINPSTEGEYAGSMMSTHGKKKGAVQPAPRRGIPARHWRRPAIDALQTARNAAELIAMTVA